MPTKVGAIAGRVYHTTMFFLLVTIGLGTAFIVLTMSSRFFKWKVRLWCMLSMGLFWRLKAAAVLTMMCSFAL